MFSVGYMLSIFVGNPGNGNAKPLKINRFPFPRFRKSPEFQN
jgi:hypothetical protein